MNFLKNSKADWKCILIVILFAFACGAAILFCRHKWFLQAKPDLIEPIDSALFEENIFGDWRLPGNAFIRDVLEIDIENDGENEMLVLYILNKETEIDETPW